ncbi:MAG: hypothetical protein KF690_05920 [Bacteroidetes bacterium]|nr:hypothetical protein [Bacteroidota bacterium]
MHWLIRLFLCCTCLVALSCSRAEEAIQKMESAEQQLKEGYFVKAAHLAEEALKLDSTEALLYRRGMVFIEAGVLMDKNDFKEDAANYLRRGLRDLERTESFYDKNGDVYFYRAVARSLTFDKVGACRDIYQAEAYGKRVPQKVKDHAECAHIESLTAKRELNAESGPGLDYQDRPESPE